MRLARRVLLSLIALVFAAIAIANVVAPDVMAEGIGQTLSNVDALNEHRAIYVGLWLAHALVFAWAVRKPDDATLFSVCVLLIGGQVLGRALSLALDGLPTMKLVPIFAAETIAVVALLIGRPRR